MHCDIKAVFTLRPKRGRVWMAQGQARGLAPACLTIISPAHTSSDITPAPFRSLRASVLRIPKIYIRNSAKCILTEGLNEKKREQLGCLKNRLTLKDGKVWRKGD